MVALDTFRTFEMGGPSQLDALRLKIIGDEEEKLRLLDSEYKLVELLDEFADYTEINNVLIILNSLTYLRDAFYRRFVVQLGGTGSLLHRLVGVAVRARDEEMLKLALNLISNVLEILRENSNDELVVLRGAGAAGVGDEVYGAFMAKLAGFLADLKQNEEIISIILKMMENIRLDDDDRQIIELVLGLFDELSRSDIDKLMARYRKDVVFVDYFKTTRIGNLHSVNKVSRLMAPVLNIISNLLGYRAADEERPMAALGDFFTTERVFYITLLVKSNDFKLKYNSIKFMINFTISKFQFGPELDELVIIKKITPYVLQLIDINCGFDLLLKICLYFDNKEIFGYFLSFKKLLEKFNTIVTKTTDYDDEQSLFFIGVKTQVFLILSLICSNTENNRKKIISLDLKNEFLHILSSHVRYLNSIKDGSGFKDRKFHERNELCIAMCYCLKSISRSTGILRTFLNDDKLCEYLIELIKLDERKELISLQNVSLSILSNFVLSFSPLRNLISNPSTLELVFHKLDNTKDELIKINCLWILKNLIHEETSIKKEMIFQKFDLKKLVAYCGADNNPEIINESICIIRNLIWNSKSFINKFSKLFIDGDEGFVNYFCGLLLMQFKEGKNIEIMENLLFLIVNISSSSEQKRELLVRNDDLLFIISKILQSFDKERSQLRSVCVWLLINLTMPSKDEIAANADDGNGEISKRIFILKNKFNILEILKKLLEFEASSEDIDLQERICLVIKNCEDPVNPARTQLQREVEDEEIQEFQE